MKDRELMMRVKTGDRSAFRLIVEKYQRRVINVAYRLIGNRDEAEEVAQETFLRVYLSAHSYKPKAELFTWLYRIATNLALNQLRRKRHLPSFSLDRQRTHREGELVREIAADPKTQPDIALERKERELAVQNALDALPPAQKIAVILSRYEGLSYKQIAEVMGTSVSAVESKLFRAKGTLRKKLRTYFEEM